MATSSNPLRYPGSKKFLVNYIDDLLASNNLLGCTFIEPYAGSVAVGLELLRRKHIERLVICEKDVLLYAFWECVFRHTDELCSYIETTPITIETWLRLEELRDAKEAEPDNLVLLGFAGLFFNRTNFSGILKANPIGGINQTSQYRIDCRFNKTTIIKTIRDLSKYEKTVEVYHNDAINFLQAQTMRFIANNCFVYLDPPYFEQGKKIYRHYYSNYDHLILARYIQKVRYYDWLISYDDAPFICGLYSDSGAKYQPIFLDYSCAPRVRSHGQELLISNLPLPPFPIGDSLEV